MANMNNFHVSGLWPIVCYIDVEVSILRLTMSKYSGLTTTVAAGLTSSIMTATLFAYSLECYVKPDVPNSFVFTTAAIVGVLFGSVSTVGFMLGASTIKYIFNKNLINM